jgi:hypothetical protein
MKPAVARLLVTAALFVAWLLYLGYLVVCRPHTPSGLRGAFEGRPLTLSRPQFLVSAVGVIAQVNDEKGEDVTIKEVLYPREKAPVQAGDKIKVTNLDKCRALRDPMEKDREVPLDYTGPGEYLLPLQVDPRKDDKTFEVVPTPPSPGYPPGHGVGVGPPRLYPATPEMLAEYRQIAKP